MLALLLIGVLFCGALSAPTNEEKVIGGRDAAEGEIPYIISLKSYGSHSCGGSILDENHILTAAHCVYGSSSPSAFSVQYGVLDSKSRDNIINVSKLKWHEGFIFGQDYPNDIAILKLAESIKFGPNVSPTVLPTSNLTFAGDSVPSRLSGWGIGSGGGLERYLQTAEFPLFNDATCKKYLSSPYPPNYNPQYHVCAGDLDGSHKQCSGDSGGPLYADGAQHGVVSWSIKPCTSSGHPGVFTRVAVHLDWIKKTIQEL